MKKTTIIVLAIADLLTFAGSEILAATCPRCRRDRNWFAWYPKCRTIYCSSCSSESGRQIGKLTYSCCSLTCPRCGYSKCKKLK